MASKNVHDGEFPDQAVIDLGFEDGEQVGLVCNDVETLYLSESGSMYNKIENLLSTETTSDLTTVKRAFILPMHNVSTERLKASLKEHKISITNDYEKADFIIPHTNFYQEFSQVSNIPQSKLIFKLSNGYFAHLHRTLTHDYHDDTTNNVLLDKRSLGDSYQYNIDYESAPYDSYCFSNMSLVLADLIEKGEMKVINVYATDFLDYISHKYNRNKDVMYWMDKYSINKLSRCSAEEAIRYFDESGELDSRCFRALEVKCRNEIQIYNRELYTFKVQVKPEYRKYMED